MDNPGLQYALEQMQSYVELSIDNFEKSKDSLLAMVEENSFVVDAIQRFIVAQGMCNATINVYTSNPNYTARRYILVANI